MKKLATVVIVIATLAGCAQLPAGVAASGASSGAATQQPEWLRDPARSEYPYNARGW